jgi:hypothetical protein
VLTHLGEVSQWAYHKAVRVGDRVYDRITGGEGMHIDDYKKMFGDNVDSINFE